MPVQDHQVFLRSVGLFKGLSREELRGLDNLVLEKTFKKGEAVINQGDDDRDVFLVFDGSAEAEIELHLDEQTSRRVATFKAGDFFGEIAMVDRHPRSATVRAGEGGLTVLQIPFGKLETIMDRNHHVGYVILNHIAGALCERIRATNVQVGDTFTWGRL